MCIHLRVYHTHVYAFVCFLEITHRLFFNDITCNELHITADPALTLASDKRVEFSGDVMVRSKAPG